MPLPIIEMRAISKRFGALLANDNVSLSVAPGEILGLLGENGAGKTTLMNILFGVYAADGGSIRIDGKPAQIRSSAEALNHGIGMVHQHFHLAPRLTVIENLLVGTPGKNGRLDIAGAKAKLKSIEQEFGLKLNPDALVAALAVGEQQRLEIIKALLRDARLLILDEPTAVLAPSDVDGLFAALRAIAAKGLGIIKIDAGPDNLRVQFVPQPPIDPMKIIAMIQSRRNIKMSGPDKLSITAEMPTPESRVTRVLGLFKELQ